MDTCATCKHYNFKTQTEKAWGYCMNPKARDAMYLSVRIPDDIENKYDLYQFKQRVREYVAVYFEEMSFGCIHHEKFEDTD